MKRKLLVLSLLALTLPSIAGCNNIFKSKNSKAASRMEIEINPDIEVLLDENGIVVSVTALNDDGAIVISGEKIVGKTAEEASKIIVDISYKCGYLNETNANVNVSISSDDVTTLYNNVSNKINEYLDTTSLDATISNKTSDFLANLDAKIAEISCSYEKSEIASMTLEEKLTILNEYRLEAEDLVTSELQESYGVAKANEYKEELLSKKQEAIEKLDAASGQAYNQLVTLLENAIDKIDKLYEDNFIDSNSAYQQALTKLSCYKLVFALMKNSKTINEMISVIDNSTLSSDLVFTAIRSSLSLISPFFGDIDFTTQANIKSSVDSAFNSIQQSIDTIVSTINKIKDQTTTLIDQAKTQLQTVLDDINDYELQLPSNIISNLESKANEFVKAAEKEVKDAHDEFYNDHKDEIEAAKKRHAELKAALLGNE